MTTWKDIKLATLQKMFSSNGTTIQADSSTAEYIYAMPQAANEALQLLATAGKFIVKTLEIDVKPYANLIGDTAGFKEYYIQGEGHNMTFSAKGCHSLYLKVRGHANVSISYPYIVHDEETGEDEVQLYEEVIEVSNKEYASIKRILDNPDNDVVTVVVEALFPTNVKNIALYAEKFEVTYDEEENPVYDNVPDYERFIKYHMDKLLEDFYQLYEIYYEGPDKPYYLQVSSYYQEADKTLVLQRNEPGTYTVYYKAYPSHITLETPDDYELALDPEVATLLPMYMASQLYKDDDNSISTVYRNEWEVAFERLSQNSNAPHKEEFTSESGW
jgi:hypothetical protein